MTKTISKIPKRWQGTFGQILPAAWIVPQPKFPVEGGKINFSEDITTTIVTITTPGASGPRGNSDNKIHNNNNDDEGGSNNHRLNRVWDNHPTY